MGEETGGVTEAPRLWIPSTALRILRVRFRIAAFLGAISRTAA